MRQLERFTGPDTEAAKDAFTHLSSEIIPVLRRSLGAILPRESDREDSIASTLVKLWEKRTSFEIRGDKAWWSYVCTIGRNCALSVLHDGGGMELDEDLTVADSTAIQTFATYRYERERLYRLADELWLGISPELEERERHRRLLAAQLFYLHDQSVNEIVSILGTEPLSRATLDDWLSDEPTLRDLSFNELYLENEALAEHLLEIESDMTLEDLDRLACSSQPPNGWTWPEAKVVLVRYRNGLITDKILQLFPEMPPAEVEALLQRCLELLPFAERARCIRQTLKSKRVGTEAVVDSGLWKRLVFGYYAACDLPQKQIFERTEPPASVLGYHLTEPMLNAWLSSGRLCKQLAKYSEVAHAN